LKELREDVKSIKVELSTLSETATTTKGEFQSLIEAIGNIISDHLKKMKSEILEEIAKGNVGSVLKSSFDREDQMFDLFNLGATLDDHTPTTSPIKPTMGPSVIEVVASPKKTPLKGQGKKKGGEEAVCKQSQRKVCG
jgi:hypothetical protein